MFQIIDFVIIFEMLVLVFGHTHWKIERHYLKALNSYLLSQFPETDPNQQELLLKEMLHQIIWFHIFICTTNA